MTEGRVIDPESDLGKQFGRFARVLLDKQPAVTKDSKRKFLEFFSVRAKDWFSLVEPLATQIFYFRLIAIGAVLILLIMWRPQGIFPEPKFVAKRPRWVIGR